MGCRIELNTADGATICAYCARPDGPSKGGLVILQEIFGVTEHIRAVADRYAAAGYIAIAPALFDRVEADTELPYEAASFPKARELRAKLTMDKSMSDIAAAVEAAAVEAAAEGGRVGIVGYCWGGQLAYVAGATVPGVAAVVGYYAGDIVAHLQPRLQAAVMLHFGEQDHLIPLEDVETVRAAHPEAVIHLYPAGHGFDSAERASFHEPSSQSALLRTLAFLDENLA